MLRKLTSAITLLTLPWIVNHSALAQLEEIIVTAQRREESLQDVPISVTAVTGQSILEMGFSDIDDLANFIPNLYVNDSIVGQSLAVRGVSTSASNEAFEQAVAQFHDGVYYARDNMSNNSFFDLERIEIVRGPQPTFAGQSATAGVLNYISRRPGDTFEGYVVVGAGDDEEYNAEFAMGGPLTDNLGVRIAGRWYELGDTGYTHEVTGRNWGVKENSAFRATAVWAPSDDFEMTVKFERNDVWQLGTPNEFTRCDDNLATSVAQPFFVGSAWKAGCAMVKQYLGLDYDNLDGVMGRGGQLDAWEVARALDARQGNAPGTGWTPVVPPVSATSPTTPAPCVTWCINAMPEGLNKVAEYGLDEDREHQSDVAMIRMNWNNNGYDIVSTTSMVGYDKHDWLDPDGTSIAFFTDERLETYDQVAQEITIASPVDQTFSWLLGWYYQSTELVTTIDVYLPRTLFWLGDLAIKDATGQTAIARSSGGTLLEDGSWSGLFFSGVWNLNDSMRINIGGRYQDIQKDGTLTTTSALLYPGMTTYYPGGVRTRIPGKVTSESADASDFLPEVAFEWDASDNTMVYIRHAEALKAGGFVMSPALAGTGPDPFTYNPEYAKGIELGFKSQLLNNRLQLNMAFYSVDYTDLQRTVYVFDTSQFITKNAAEAHTKGFEFDGRWAVTDNFTLGFNGTSNEAMYDKYYPGPSCNPKDKKLFVATTGQPACFYDMGGEKLGAAPDWTIGLQPEYRFTMGGSLEGTLAAMIITNDDYCIYQCKYNTTPDPLNTVKGEARIDGRFAIRPVDGNWEVAIYGRDLTDRRLIRGGALSVFSKTGAPDFDASGVSRERGRRVGVQYTYNFGN